MEPEKRKLPVGIQSFEQIINEHYLLVDKTEYVYKLVHTGKPYFLSRPRRFGKSLLLSTMRAYWEGKKELFQGLKIEALEQENADAWQAYPIFYFDFNGKNYQAGQALETVLDGLLSGWELTYHVSKANGLEERFKRLLQAASAQTGKKCVVLVDEYDKPLIETMENKELVKHNKAVFKGFFSTLKSEDACIQFIFITGVTKFSKVSIFSDLNQLRDISMSMDYSEICGITEQEMRDVFMPEIEAMADEQELTVRECLGKLKMEYDGYRFHQKGMGVYNPYSLLNALADREFDAYWFETGTPSFLVARLKEMHFDSRKFTDGTLYATKRMLKDYRDDNPDPIPLLYQTGYLTIIDYSVKKAAYTLGFPNEEVKYGFLDSLMPLYTGNAGAGSGKDILTLSEYVESGDLESIRRVFEALFAGIPYPINEDPFEHDFQSVFYITFTLLGQYVQCETHTFTGRIDCIVETKRFVYIFEFKRDDSAENALQQIEDMHYTVPYAADKRRLYKIGVKFDSKTRQMADWKVTE
ncbi:MAG: ATP-binding protein [Lachnospiraceae bacterium]|nr:ATP-binding protein [Lachnospiraceae bacterium]